VAAAISLTVNLNESHRDPRAGIFRILTISPFNFLTFNFLIAQVVSRFTVKIPVGINLNLLFRSVFTIQFTLEVLRESTKSNLVTGHTLQDVPISIPLDDIGTQPVELHGVVPIVFRRWHVEESVTGYNKLLKGLKESHSVTVGLHVAHQDPLNHRETLINLSELLRITQQLLSLELRDT
jgi:hypothetical protein